MKHEPAIFDRRDPTPMAEAIAQARLDYGTGRGVDHVVVREWLMTWGTPGRLPFKEWLANWDE